MEIDDALGCTTARTPPTPVHFPTFLLALTKMHGRKPEQQRAETKSRSLLFFFNSSSRVTLYEYLPRLGCHPKPEPGHLLLHQETNRTTTLIRMRKHIHIRGKGANAYMYLGILGTYLPRITYICREFWHDREREREGLPFTSPQVPSRPSCLLFQARI